MELVQTRPNLFQFATSELSQDAMLCWLASWADPAASDQDQALHRLGQSFLQAAFAKHGQQLPNIVQPIQVRTQHRNIDVLVVINDTIALCIEDKVGTTEHSEQLQRAVGGLREDGFSEEQIIPVYVQTGDQGSYESVRAAGYEIMSRRDLIGLLDDYLGHGGSDSIARDFHGHLSGIERKVEAFRILPLSEWDWYAWRGFYSELQHLLDGGEWAYVPTPAGGFVGYWWHEHSDADSNQYLQIEERKLCFKISVNDPSNRCHLRSQWMDRILAVARSRNFPAVRPSRLGAGTCMTVAVFEGEYRAVNEQGSLDLDATVATLRSAEDFLDKAVAGEPEPSSSAAAPGA